MATLPVTESLIRQSSTAESFARGERSYEAGAVVAIVRRGNVVQAEVSGSEPDPYLVTIVVDEHTVGNADCTCPYDWGGWCKHIVATLLAALHDPAAIEERKPLHELLAQLDRDALQTLLLRLVAQEPSLIDMTEAEIGSLARAASPPATVDAAAVRRELRALFRGVGRGRGGGDYWSVGSIVDPVERTLQHARDLIGASDGRRALTVLDAITDEVWSNYEGMDDSDGDGVPLFEGIGATWAEAFLCADVTPEDRQNWGAKVDAWHGELSDYGLEDAFYAAVQAAEQGWDFQPLVRVLQGHDTRQSLWEDGPPDWIADEALARARLNVLERNGRRDEYLRFADAAGQGVAHATMLVALGRAPEAVAYALKNLSTSEEALALAQVLRERQEPTRALKIAEHGLGLEGYKSSLATWTAGLAVELGAPSRAMAAAEIGFRELPTLEGYRRLQDLAGDDWPNRRRALLDHLRGMHSYVPQGQVEIFLYEGLIDHAIAAVADGASHTVLEQVADAALPTHPDWVIETSRRQAAAIMDPGKSEYYYSAAQWVARARDAYRVAGRDADWQAYVRKLLTQHGRKYKLVPLLKALEH